MIDYVIWSFEHAAWWGPRRMGYTEALAAAGRYTKAEADRIVAHANIIKTNEQALPLSEAVEWGPPTKLGSCCACGGPRARNVLMLHRKAPMAGRGWGCLVCGLPNDGAVAVLCNACFEADAEILYACAGYPGIDGRLPIRDLDREGVHEHDEAQHAHDTWTRIAPGVYDDHEGGLHIELTEMLKGHGYADTPENRDTLLAAAKEMGLSVGATVTVTDKPVTERT
jgi:hypothetical protein